MISEVFGGDIRSSIKYTNEKQSNTSQPFFTLQLDIHVCSFAFIFHESVLILFYNIETEILFLDSFNFI